MKNSNAKVSLLVGVAVAALFLFVAVAAGIFLAVRAVLLAPRPFGANGSATAYPQPGPGAKDFDELFADYGKCMKAKGAGTQRHWDVVRFAKEIDRTGVLTRQAIGPDNPNQLVILEKWIADTEADTAKDEVWDEIKIQDIRWLIPQQEAEIKIQHTSRANGGVSHRYERWSVVFDGGWRFFDKESIGNGFRYSDDVRLDLSEQSANGVAQERARQQAQDDFVRAQDVYKRGDYAQAERLFADKKLNRLPASFLPLRTQWQAMTALRLEKYEVARELLVQAEQEAPRSADVFDYLTEALYSLNEYDRALAASDRYLQLAGPDARICVFRGHSLAGLKRPLEAAIEYRRALDDNPDDEMALAQLGTIVGAAGVAELEARFRRFRDPGGNLQALLRWGGTDPTVRAMYVRVVRERAPTHPEALFEDARLKLTAGNVAAAVPLFRQALAGTTDEAGKERLYDRLATEAAVHHHATAVYQALNDAEADQGFRHLAEALEDERDLGDAKDGQEFESLLTAHRARRPMDVWLAYCEGLLFYERKKYDDAEARLANAMNRAPDDRTRERFRWLRVSNLAAANRFADAYTRVGPVRATFDQLANHFFRPEDGRTLAKLIWIHGKVASSDPQLQFWRGHAAFQSARYEEAVTELRSYLNADEAKADWRTRNDLVRALLRLKRFPEARAALPKAERFNYFNGLLAAAVTAASGDVDGTEKALDAMIADRYASPAIIHEDVDLSAALHTEPFRRLLEKYPVPKAEPAPAKK
jgi:Flp pilus assembly protein TadD